MLFEQLDLEQIQDVAQAKRAIVGLLNLVEDLQATVHALQGEVQRLCDEINHLKGEQGKPDIKPNRRDKQPGPGTDHSSEAERRKPQTWLKGGKLAQITINREAVLTVDPAQLPADAEFKGYEDSIVQGVVLRTDNVLFHKEKYYSPRLRRTYLAALPPGYAGQFGPGIKALALVQYFACNMADPKILEFFATVGIHLSAGELSNWLIKDWPELHAEKAAIYAAGLRSSPWQHLDDMAARVNGQNEHCHAVCNPLYTAYFTTARKERLTIVDVLRNLGARTFRVNAEAIDLLRIFGLAQSTVRRVQGLPQAQDLQEAEFTALLDARLPTLGPQQRARILEAAAVAAYHAQLEFPVIKLLLCDDAPQFNWVTEQRALCWIHEGRHYKKLDPSSALFRTALTEFTKSTITSRIVFPAPLSCPIWPTPSHNAPPDCHWAHPGNRHTRFPRIFEKIRHQFSITMRRQYSAPMTCSGSICKS